ncbi:hypothetical protein [Streptomyces flaveolus]|uniref:hypothetical protein n=1 Tax=Streptomyces flaveolus TaxID=67297 RepID=UPI0036F7D962
MSRWTPGLTPLRTLAARLGNAAGSNASGPVHLLSSDPDESELLGETIDALRGGEPDQATVVVAASVEQSRGLWRRLTPLLDGLRRSGITVVRLVWAGSGADLPGRRAPARRIADDWRMEVIAPAGPVVVAPGGSLFAPPAPDGPGGWWHFGPGLTPRPLGLRHPVPSWEDAAARLTPDAVEGHVIESVPAGVLIHRPEALSDAAQVLGASIPVDEHRLAVVVGTFGTPPVTAQALAELLSLLPTRARAAARLLPGDGRDLLDAGQETADLLGVEVEVLSGVPVLLDRTDADGTEAAVVLMGADGEPAWRPFVEAVACAPAAGGRAPAPRLVRWRPPLSGLAAASENGVLLLDDEWKVAVTRAGLWVGPRSGERPETSGWSVSPETVVLDVGVPGQPVDEGLWPVLRTLVEGLEPSVSGRTTLHVLGRCDTRDRRHLRRFVEQAGLSLEYGEEASVGHAADDAPAAGPEQTHRSKGPAAAGSTALGGDNAAQAPPWHTSPMSVRIRHVAAPAAPVPERPAEVTSQTFDEAATALPARGPRNAVPPGFAEAYAASRSVGRPGSRSVPVSWNASAGAAPAEVRSASPVVPTVQGRPSPVPSPPVSSVAPSSVPPAGAEASRPEPVATASAFGASLPVRVGPLHRSTPADRQALRSLAGPLWWQHQATVTRMLTMVPGLRTQAQNEDVQADLVAVRCYVTLDDGPLSWTWLRQRLVAGSDEALPYLACLASGLRLLPSYRGVVIRDAAGISQAGRSPAPGTELREATPVGTLTLDGAPPSAGDRYVIWSVTGRRVRSLFSPTASTGNTEEIVFGPGTRFRVLGTEGRPGAMTVLLREVAEGDPAARSGEHQAQDRSALEQLLQAAGRAPETGTPGPWPSRLTGELARRPGDAGGDP